MNKHNHSRGHEMPDHCELKPKGRNLALDAGFDMAICEYHNCDVVAKRRIGKYEYVLTIEFERTVRNILRNIRRNMLGGCDHQLIVCIGSLTVDTVERLLARNLTSRERKAITVISQNGLSIDVLKTLTGDSGVDSGCFGNTPTVNSFGQPVNSETANEDSALVQGRCDGRIAKTIKDHG